MMKTAVVYWSGTGNTEAMANAVAKGAKDAGAEVEVFKATEFNSRYIGKTVEVLVEGYTNSNEDTQTGRTDGNIIVNFPSCGAVPGTYKNILIDKALNWAIFGKATEN